jgi:hypothetical protein
MRGNKTAVFPAARVGFGFNKIISASPEQNRS